MIRDSDPVLSSSMQTLGRGFRLKGVLVLEPAGVLRVPLALAALAVALTALAVALTALAVALTALAVALTALAM